MSQDTHIDRFPAWSVENKDGHSVTLLPCECCESLTLAVEIDAATVFIRIDDINMLEEVRDGFSAAVEYQKSRLIRTDAEDDHVDMSGPSRPRCWQGHAPSRIRRPFLEWLDLWIQKETTLEEDLVMLTEDLLPALSSCTDILPRQYCERLDLRRGSTYADAVELLYSNMA